MWRQSGDAPLLAGVPARSACVKSRLEPGLQVAKPAVRGTSRPAPAVSFKIQSIRSAIIQR
jgi:hypothetical protein